MINCVQSIFSHWSTGRRDVLIVLLCLGLPLGAFAQAANSVLSTGSWYFLETTSDDVYVIDGDVVYGDLQLSAPISFASLGLFSSSEGPLQEANKIGRAHV